MEQPKIEITKDALVGMLIDGVVEVEFIKADGSQRVMKCTLSPDYLPEATEEEVQAYDAKPKRQVTLKPDQVRVYDIEAQGYRTVTLSKLIREPIPVQSSELPGCGGECPGCQGQCQGDIY